MQNSYSSSADTNPFAAINSDSRTGMQTGLRAPAVGSLVLRYGLVLVARGLSEMRLGSIGRSLWTYTIFLSKHPVKDTYGAIETPENLGLIPTADTAIVPDLPSDSSTAPTRPNENP
jgi:hypothetical protein